MMFKFKRIKYFISILKWLWSGGHMIIYDGYTCGLCGEWTNKMFCVADFNSLGKRWDTWSICDEGSGCRKEGL